LSTYLELCQDLRRETGIAGTGPTSVANQIAQLDRLVHWVRNAWTEIQNRHAQWRWMRSGFTLTTVSSQSAYAPSEAVDDLTAEAIARFSRWWIDDCMAPPTFYLQSAGQGGEGYLSFIDWPIFRHIYDRGTQAPGQPAHITIDPQNRLVLGPTPNDVYIIRGEYQRSAQTLTDDSDVPECPAQFHQLIVMRALEKYGLFASAQEVVSRAQADGDRLMRQLEANQLPLPALASPLA